MKKKLLFSAEVVHILTNLDVFDEWISVTGKNYIVFSVKVSVFSSTARPCGPVHMHIIASGKFSNLCLESRLDENWIAFVLLSTTGVQHGDACSQSNSEESV